METSSFWRASSASCSGSLAPLMVAGVRVRVVVVAEGGGVLGAARSCGCVH